ncbi:MAG: rod shape-determining protein MreD [Alphaproteobacteria bacterium]|nr:rod shape-determining protein MreD [Alphaproteobacteria bacterium]
MRSVNIRFWVWRLMPFFLCLVLIVCHLVPFHFLPYYPYAVQWCIVPIFYFAIYNPRCLSSWAVFILGMISDLFVQSPFGVTVFCFVLLYFIANFLRKYLLEMTFIPLWTVFASLFLIIEFLNYELVDLLAQYPVSFQPIFVEFWILTLIYPFMMRFCAHLDRKAREVVP